MSQEEVAFRCDLDRTFVGMVERGEGSLSLKTIVVLTAHLGVSTSTVFREAEDLLHMERKNVQQCPLMNFPLL